MAEGGSGDGPTTAGLWRAYLDRDTKRVFWEDQHSGAVSWYVAPPDPDTLPVRSYLEAGGAPSSSMAGSSESHDMCEDVQTVRASEGVTRDNVREDSSADSRSRATSSVGGKPLLHTRPRPASSSSLVHSSSKGIKSLASAPQLLKAASAGPQIFKAPLTGVFEEPLPPSSEQERLKTILVAGMDMNKHRSRGTARRRFIVFSNNWDRIMWAKSRRDFLMGNVLGRIKVKDMVEVREGFDRSLFRANFDKPEQGECCFTLQASYRTLNLETDRASERTDWVNALHYVISKYKLDSVANVLDSGSGVGGSDEIRPPSTESDSQGKKLLKTMTFWKWGTRESRSDSDSNFSGTSSRVQSTSSDSLLRSDSGRPQSLTNLSSASRHGGRRDSQHPSKGSLLALEENFNALQKYAVQCRKQVEILGEACGRTIDMLWESGARDNDGADEVDPA